MAVQIVRLPSSPLGNKTTPEIKGTQKSSGKWEEQKNIQNPE
jgi:hypothetical protein